MPTTQCELCGNEHSWKWEEAFEKFGFGDGAAAFLTDEVCTALNNAGYWTQTEAWGIHNTVITSIKNPEGREFIECEGRSLGYDCPRTYLPADIIKVLDKALPY